MRHLAILLALVPLGACATVSPPRVATVTLSAEKAFLTAQTAFAGAQTVAIAGIKSGVISGQFKMSVIDLLDKGARYEALAYKGDTVAIRNLTDVVADLAKLGIKGK